MFCLSNRLPCIIISNSCILVQQTLQYEKRHLGIKFQMWDTNSSRGHSHVRSATADDDYRKVISTLNTLQSEKRAQNDATIVQHRPRNMLTMLHYLTKSGMKIEEFEKKLRVIHVSGTKGKGSTCAYCECILRQYGYKTGFFSSPHLCSVRERIRINGESLSKRKFAEYFKSVYEKLKKKEETNSDSSMPPYFMFLTVMAFKVFVEEKVDVAIIEVGIGGEYDCTNILKNTAVAGISSLGYDHVRILGKSIEEIAWQKSGIIKPSSIVVTAANQSEAALRILQSRATEKGRALYVAPDLSEYESNEEIVLGINGPVQRLNASLALQLTNAWMNPERYPQGNLGEVQRAAAFELSKEMLEGLKTCSWPGRTQILQFSTKLWYYLDGAHTDESIEYCLQWFEMLVIPSSTVKVLVFNMIGDRDAKTLLRLFLPHRFDLVCFCTNMIESLADKIDTPGDNWSHPSNEDEKRAEQNYNHWLEINPSADEHNTMLFSNVSEVHEWMQKLAVNNHLQVVVTGSLYLVGAFLSVLTSQDEEV